MFQINRTIAGNGAIMTLPGKMRTAEEMHTEWSEIQAAQRDATQFRPLYNRYYEAVYRFVWRRVADESLSADLCSQVFLKAMQSIGTYTFRGVPFSAWLFRIAVNEIQLHYRAQKRVRVVSVEDSQLHLMESEMLVDNTQSEADLANLLRSMSSLKAEDLAIIEMRFFEDRPFKEIGAILNISENNAKVKTYRILERLKRKMLT